MDHLLCVEQLGRLGVLPLIDRSRSVRWESACPTKLTVIASGFGFLLQSFPPYVENKLNGPVYVPYELSASVFVVVLRIRQFLQFVVSYLTVSPKLVLDQRLSN